MDPPSEPPMSDPLLRTDVGPRDVRGEPVRAPLGNSIMTLLALVALVGVGVGVWWLRRPADHTMSLGAREWVIAEVDGEPATNALGTASSFVLDGTGDARGMVGCNTSIGTWSFEPGSGRLVIGWDSQTLAGCVAWPETYLPDSGVVDLDGGVLHIDGDDVDVVAFSPTDHAVAEPEDVTGAWTTAGTAVQIGRRGLFEVGTCRGSWEALTAEDGNPGLRMDVSFGEVQRDDCELADWWRDETPFVPFLHGGALFLRRDRTAYPFERWVVRLEDADADR